jgi:hypothetical protein
MPLPGSGWIPVIIVAMFVVMGAGISLLGGWHELAGRFRSDDPIEGERFRFRSGSMGWPYFPVNYGGCLFATVGPRGFRLSVIFAFRFLHPPLVIPWTEVERCEPARYWFRKYAAVYVKNFGRRLLFPGSLGDGLLSTWTRVKAAA